MAPEPTRAVLFDALGTLVRLEPPVPRLVAALGARGAAVSPGAAAAAMRAEIALYRAEHHRAGTAAALEQLRDECAAVVQERLQTGLAFAEVRAALLEAIRFETYEEVPAALAALGSAGVALGVVSNWDVSLHGVLEQAGLRDAFSVVVTSAELGAAKPDPRPFLVALERLGVAPSAALHVGDDLDADIGGARAAGVQGILVVREGGVRPPGVTCVGSLASITAPGL